MGCAACGSGEVKQRDRRGKERLERLEGALTAVFRAYEKRDIYFLANHNGQVFSLAAAVAIVRECEQIEVAMGLKRGMHSVALWAGLLDKPEIAALIEDIKDTTLEDGKIFVVEQFGAGGLVTADNIKIMSPTEAAKRSSRAP